MQPTVSVIVPCFNEQATIGSLLAALYEQTYPRSKMEIVIADGQSVDGTREAIQAFVERHGDLEVRVVDNEKGTIPAGLNAAIGAARGEFIVRMDAHSRPIPQYVERCVADLQAGKADNVGGLWEIRPGGPGAEAAAIAAVAGHPLGAGDASYRLGGLAGAVDTVPFGAFRRGLALQLGGFDERLLTNEDYEFNVRIRKNGGVVWLDPEIRSQYFARTTLGELARQYWRYGFWKARMLMKHPESLRWRQAIPPAFVLGLVASLGCALLWAPARPFVGAGMLLYAALLVAAGIQLAARSRNALVLPYSVPAFAIIHVAWGAGFLGSLVRRWGESHG